MDIKMFLEFPGVLITIGVVLLLISIIIIIIAYRKDRKDNKPIDALKLSESGIIAESDSSTDVSTSEDELDKTKMFPRTETNNSKNDNNLSIPKIDIKQVLDEKIDNADDIDDNSKVMDAFEEEFGDYDKKSSVKKVVTKDIEPSDDDDVELL